MATAKMILYLLNAVGLSVYIAGVVVNFDTWKGWFLLIGGAAFWIVKTIVYIIKSRQDITMRNLKIEEEKRKLYGKKSDNNDKA